MSSQPPKTPKPKKPITELTDKQVIRALFPKEVVKTVEKEIGRAGPGVKVVR